MSEANELLKMAEADTPVDQKWCVTFTTLDGDKSQKIIVEAPSEGGAERTVRARYKVKDIKSINKSKRPEDCDEESVGLYGLFRS